jgi:predicted amidophosphoribosyltransferase
MAGKQWKRVGCVPTKEYMHMRYMRRKRAGLCVDCLQPALSNNVHCARCYAKKQQQEDGK